MNTLICTDGQADEIINGVGLTVERFAAPDGIEATFGDISRGYKRRVNVQPDQLAGLYCGGGCIGYFSEAALAKPRPGLTTPLLVELIAAGDRHDVVVPPLGIVSAASIAGSAAPTVLSLDEQHALFVRVLGSDWADQVRRHVSRPPAKRPG